jgi:hypothetical protein
MSPEEEIVPGQELLPHSTLVFLLLDMTNCLGEGYSASSLR